MRLLLTGASGQLGAYLLRQLRGSLDLVAAWSGSFSGNLFEVQVTPVDLANPDQVIRCLDDTSPDCILHTAALARLADCEKDPRRAYQINVQGTAVLTEQARRRGLRLLYVSTDLVFDGEQAPYRESAEPRPVSVYGRTKREAEQVVLQHTQSVVVRVSLLFGPSLNGRPSFFDQQRASLQDGQSLPLFADEWRTPLALDTAATALLGIAHSSFTGLLHLGGPERMSRLEMGLRLAAFLGIPSHSILSVQRPNTGEPRPRDVSLDSSRWRQLFPDFSWSGWEDSLRRMFSVCR